MREVFVMRRELLTNALDLRSCLDITKMSEYLKTYGPAVANLVVTMGCYFHLKSKINSINPEVKLDDVYARLEAIEKSLNQIVPVLQHHDAFLKKLASERSASTEVETTKPPSPEKKDQKNASPKSASPKAKSKPTAAPVVRDSPQDSKASGDNDIEDQIDSILGEDAEPSEIIELEATEATEASPPKTAPKKKGAPPKKTFKKT